MMAYPNKYAIDGTTAMNVATNDENERTIQQAEQQKAASEFTQMARQAALNALQRQMAGNIVAQKMNYRDALANGDIEAMDYANKLAEAQRAQGNAIGWDGAGYGSDVPLEQAAQNLANNDARALANIFYNQQNADDHYTMEIANLLDKGYSIDSAKRMAAQSADRLDRKNNAELIDSFATYGLDPRGVLTNNGVRILGELAQNGNSELANFYANMYAKPVQNWGFENSLITAANADRYARGRQVLSGEIQNQLAQNNWERNETTRNNDVQRYLAQAEGMVGIKALDAQTQAAVRSNIIKPLMENKLVTPEMAASYVATGYLVPKGTNGKGTTSGMKPDSGMFKALMEHANNLISRAEEAEASGNKELAAQLMAEAEQYKQQANKYAAMGGGNDGAGTGGYGDIQNDYDAFSKYYQEALNKANGNREYIDKIITDARQVNPVFADNFIGDYYTNRDSGTPSEQPSTANTPSRREYSSASNARSNPSLNGQMVVGPSGGNVIQKVVDAFNPQLPVYGENDKIDLTKPAKKYMSLDEAKQRGLGITEINGQRVVIE